MSKEHKSIRDGFGEAVLEIAKKSSKIYVLSADLRDSLRVGKFAEELPERFVECGVAEQNMVGIAAGLAGNDKIPFATSFSVFSPGRTWDQLRVSVCISNLPVKIIGGHAGFSNSKDGASHQALEDIAITRVLPNLKVIVPADYLQTKKVIWETCKDKSPTYIRISGEAPSYITKKTNDFEIGKAQTLKKGSDITVISAGPILERVLEGVEKSSYEAEVINLHTIKPIDKETILESAEKTKMVLTVEDHQIHGGLGSAVAEVIAQESKSQLKILGVPDSFSRSAKSPEELYKYFDLDSDSIAKEINELLDD